jgi:hypothetical protein
VGVNVGYDLLGGAHYFRVEARYLSYERGGGVVRDSAALNFKEAVV